jgi:hypothetical protein
MSGEEITNPPAATAATPAAALRAGPTDPGALLHAATKQPTTRMMDRRLLVGVTVPPVGTTLERVVDEGTAGADRHSTDRPTHAASPRLGYGGMASNRCLAGRTETLVVPVGSTQGQAKEPKNPGLPVR